MPRRNDSGGCIGHASKHQEFFWRFRYRPGGAVRGSTDWRAVFASINARNITIPRGRDPRPRIKPRGHLLSNLRVPIATDDDDSPLTDYLRFVAAYGLDYVVHW